MRMDNARADPAAQPEYQQLFTAVLLEEYNSSTQVQTDTNAQQNLHDELVAQLLRAGPDPAALQAVLAGCAAAVLKVGHTLPGPTQQQVVSNSFKVMDQALQLLQQFPRDRRLLTQVESVTRVSSRPSQQDTWAWEWVGDCPEGANVLSAARGAAELQQVLGPVDT